MRRDDLFSVLSKYDGTHAAENSLTEAFVYLLNYLLDMASRREVQGNIGRLDGVVRDVAIPELGVGRGGGGAGPRSPSCPTARRPATGPSAPQPGRPGP